MEVSRLVVIVVEAGLASPVQQLVVDGEVILHVVELAVALLVDVHLRNPVVGFVSGQVTAGVYDLSFSISYAPFIPCALAELQILI